MRLGITADWHLGKNVDGTASFDRSEEVLQQIGHAVSVFREKKVDAIAVLGDVSHSNHPSIRTNVHIRNALEMLDKTGVPVLVIPGNHDSTHEGNHALQPFMHGHWQNVEIHDDLCVWQKFAVVPHLPRSRFFDPEQYVTLAHTVYEDMARNSGCQILLTHAQIAGCTVGRDYVMESGAIELPQLDAAYVKLVLAGDVHKRQSYMLGEVAVLYPGSLTQTDYGEREEIKGVCIVDTENNSVESIEVPGYVKYHAIVVSTERELDDLPADTWDGIVDITVRDKTRLTLVENSAYGKNPKSIRGIRSIDEVATVGGDKHYASLSYVDQLAEYMKTLSVGYSEEMLEIAKSIMDEVRT